MTSSAAICATITPSSHRGVRAETPWIRSLRGEQRRHVHTTCDGSRRRGRSTLLDEFILERGAAFLLDLGNQREEAAQGRSIHVGGQRSCVSAFWGSLIDAHTLTMQVSLEKAGSA
jgi:hypothetical protein